MNEVRVKELTVHIDDIKRSMNKVAIGMVEIGYHLKQIRDKGLEQEKGYIDIWNLAREEFGFSKSTTSRMVSIYETYGEEHYGLPKLKEQYDSFNKGQLIEMLNVPEAIREEIPSTATVKEIRDTKQEIKAEESQELNSWASNLKDAEKAILSLFKKEEYALKFDDIFKLCKTEEISLKEFNNKMMVLLTGNGYKTTKAAGYIIFMKEEEVTIMKGAYKEKLTYDELEDIVILKMGSEDFDTAKECWESFYGEGYPEVEVKEPEPIVTKAKITEKKEESKKKKEPIKKPTPKPEEEEPIPGQVDMDEVAEPEYIGEEETVATSQQGEEEEVEAVVEDNKCECCQGEGRLVLQGAYARHKVRVSYGRLLINMNDGAGAPDIDIPVSYCPFCGRKV